MKVANHQIMNFIRHKWHKDIHSNNTPAGSPGWSHMHWQRRSYCLPGCFSRVKKRALYRSKKNPRVSPPFLNSSDQPGWHGNELERSPGILVFTKLSSPRTSFQKGAGTKMQLKGSRKKNVKKLCPLSKETNIPSSKTSDPTRNPTPKQNTTKYKNITNQYNIKSFGSHVPASGRLVVCTKRFIKGK